MRGWSILFAWVFLGALASDGQAQIFQRIFGGNRNSEKNVKTPNPADEKRRLSEIAVELAWLADPVTFPYFLEAKADYSSIQVRGYVPNKQVRDHALRIAQLHSGLPTSDAMKEHSSLMTKPGQISAQQLQRAVTSSLRESLPKTADKIKVQAHMDGKVLVWGPVASAEEKLLVSLSLRRLHGCTSVQNLTAFPGALPVSPETPVANVTTPPAPSIGGETPESISKANSNAARWPYGNASARGKKETTPANPPTPLPTITDTPTVAKSPPSPEPPLLEETPRGANADRGSTNKGVPNIVFSPIEKPGTSNQGPDLPLLEFRPASKVEPSKGGTPTVDRTKPLIKPEVIKESPWETPGQTKPIPLPAMTVEKKEPAPITPVARPTPPPEPKGGGAPVSTAQIKRKIQDLFPKGGDVTVEFLKGNKLRIELKANSQEAATEMATRIFTLPELERLEPELVFEIPESKDGKK